MERLELTGSFLGFSFNGIHSSTLGIVRVSSSNRYEEKLLPEFSGITADKPNNDGQYIWGMNAIKRTINVNFAFVALSAADLRVIYDTFTGKQIAPLIFDESPYKVYSAKCTGQGIIKHVVSGDSNNLLYSGEGTLTFTCCFPYAMSRFQFIEDYTAGNIPEWSEGDNGFYPALLYYDLSPSCNAYLIGSAFTWANPELMSSVTATWDSSMNSGITIATTESSNSNLSEWKDVSSIPSKGKYGVYDAQTAVVPLFNAGDVPMPTQWWFLTNDLSSIELELQLSTATYLKLNSLKEVLNNKYIMIDMLRNIILGYDEQMRSTGAIFTGLIKEGNYFLLPKGETSIKVNVEPYRVDWNYLYL